MTRAEFIRDLRGAVPHVWKLKSLSPWERLQLILLKFFSIIAYYCGKFLSLCCDPGVPGQHRRLGREVGTTAIRCSLVVAFCACDSV